MGRLGPGGGGRIRGRLLAGDEEFGGSHEQDQPQDSFQPYGGHATASELSADPSSGQRGHSPPNDRGGNTENRRLLPLERRQRQVAQDGRGRIDEDEGRRHAGGDPRVGPTHQEDDGAEVDSATDAGQSREQSNAASH